MKNQHIPYSSAINDMIFDIKKKGVVSFPKKGLAENATDFFNQIIKWQFQHKATIQAIHKALLEYVKRPEPCLLSVFMQMRQESNISCCAGDSCLNIRMG